MIIPNSHLRIFRIFINASYSIDADTGEGGKRTDINVLLKSKKKLSDKFSDDI